MSTEQVPDQLRSHPLTEGDWTWASRNLPIACADVVPVVLDRSGNVGTIGLILRESPFGAPRWCHIGGRVNYGETLHRAAQRHLLATLTRPNGELDADAMPSEPLATFEFFPEYREGHGVDPRKHAVSACFRVECPQDITTRAGGEGLEFKWFPQGRLPQESQLWPGTSDLVRRVTTGPSEDLLTYETLQAQCISHNAMMWQTPVLAMTAQAFLMTTMLGPGATQVARVTAALLSLLVSMLSFQLMVKHSAMQKRDTLMLEAIERRRGMIRVHVRAEFPGWLASRESRIWWLRGLAAFGVTSLAVAIATLVSPSWFA